MLNNYKIRTKKYIINQLSMFHFPLFQLIKIRKYNKYETFYYFFKKFKPRFNQRIFYLKVHKVHITSLDCIKYWIEVANKMNAFIYFVCDNPEMEKSISDNIIFHKRNFSFIKSDRKTLKKYVSKILNADKSKWTRIAYSILTPFLHAAKNKFSISYNIDADDIQILNNPELIAKALKIAEDDAVTNYMDMANLDIYVSKTFGIHWSFGVVICINPNNCISALKYNFNNPQWVTDYVDNNIGINIDWFYTFLRDIEQLKMGTFYIENSVLVHMPDIMLRPSWAILMQFKQGKVCYPILKNIYRENIFDHRKIVPYALKIDVGILENDYSEYLNNYYIWKYDIEFDCLAVAEKRGLISVNDINNLVSEGYPAVGYARWKRIRNRKKKIPPKKITLLQRIFSVTNIGNHKVIRILGMKVKIKLKRNVMKCK